MIQELVDAYGNRKAELRKIFEAVHPEDYTSIVRAVVEIVGADIMDKARITEINHGDYQGTLVYVIAGDGYQPDDHWWVKVGYGSCSGCDTLERIKGYSDEPPTEKQVDGYMTLALHIVQGIKKMEGESV